MGNISEQIMKKRRLERLKHLNFFMTNKQVPENLEKVMSVRCTHNLLTGFFQNSKWQTAWFCIKEALKENRMNIEMNIKCFWWYKIKRLTPEEVDEILMDQN